MTSDGRCTGKVVLVTGAQRGIGRAIAIRFAEAGADVALNYLDDKAAAESAAAEITALGRKATTIGADIAKPEQARPVVATWPAYRISTSQVITLQWRMNNCYQQMRMPEPDFGSDTTVALILFLTATGKDAPYRGPGTKR